MSSPIIVQVCPHEKEPRLLTVEEVADVLDCTTTHVGSLIRAGKIHAFNFASGATTRALYRVPPLALQHFLQAAVVS